MEINHKHNSHNSHNSYSFNSMSTNMLNEENSLWLSLGGLTLNLDSTRNQILSSTLVPLYDIVCGQLLHFWPLSAFAQAPASLNVPVDSIALVSNSYQRGGRGGGCENSCI